MNLETLKPLVEIMAAERCTDRPDAFDDAVQEGLIAAWRVSKTHPEASPQYVRASARRAVVDVLRGRPMTGQAGRRGWQDAHAVADPLTDADGVLVREPAYVEPGFDGAPVRFAVAALPDLERRYVALRFWEGHTEAEIGEALDLSAFAVAKLWKSARTMLAPAVAA
jgi:RNA polymerase sigma factor (sigma-70 family)